MKFIKGYQTYKEKYPEIANDIKNDQQPEIAIISCCDSRVDPALIFNTNPGTYFSIRNVANLVPPYEKDNLHHGTSAALEFAVKFLKVKNIAILGHTKCGGIIASLDKKFPDNDFITNWMQGIFEDQNVEINQAILKSLNKSFQNLLTFPWIKERVENKELILHKWIFDIDTGKLLDAANNLEEIA